MIRHASISSSLQALCALTAATLLALACAAYAPAAASAETQTGKLSDTISWTLDGDTLTISGTGAMPNNSNGLGIDQNIIKHAVIEEGITSISSDLFNSHALLESVQLPNSLETIGAHAFAMTNLRHVTLPSNVHKIGSSAFEMTPIESFSSNATSPSNSTVAFGDNVFFSCRSLKTIVFPAGTRIIPDLGLWDNSSLGSVTLPDGLETIKASAFDFCPNLKNIRIPSSVTSIGKHAFSRCSSLKAFSFPKGITEIADNVFNECSSLTTVDIPNGITSIGAASFRGCTSLKRIAIPDKVTSIGAEAFLGCSSLKSITVPANVAKIAKRAFGCSQDYETELSGMIPGGLAKGSVVRVSTKKQFEQIAANNKYIDPDRTTVRWNDGKVDWPVSIDDPSVSVQLNHTIYAYNGSSKKPSPILKHNGTKLKRDTHYKVSYKDNIDEGTAKAIATGTGAYYEGAVETAFVILPYNAGMQAVYGSGAFLSKNIVYNITDEDDNEVEVACPAKKGVASVSIPATVRKSGVKYKVTSIGNKAFYRNTRIKSLAVGNNVGSIENYAFYGCTKLAQVKLGKKVEKLEPSSFRRCTKLASITLPKNVEELGKSCFYGCKRLKAITIKADSVIDVEDDAIEGISRTATIKVPKRFLRRYLKEFDDDSGFGRRKRMRGM